MKQWRLATLGDWDNYLSYFLFGTMQGAILNGAWHRPIPFFNHPINFIKEQIMWFKPHAILSHMIFQGKGHHNRDDVFQMLRDVRRQGTKIIYHAGDPRSVPRYIGPINDIVDFALCNHLLLKEYSEIWKVPCFHWPYMALYQKDIGEFDRNYACGMAFTGAIDGGKHHGPRSNFIRRIKERLDIRTFPTPETGNTRFQTAELSTSAKSVLGVQMGLDIPGYLDVRPFQYIGAGALYFHDRCKSMNQFFKEGIHYIGYERDNSMDLINQWNYYVRENPSAGNLIKQQGFAYCQKYHDTRERVRAVLDILEGKEYKIHYLET